MVMSTTARDSRQRCMRCGSVTLREPSGGTLLLPALMAFYELAGNECGRSTCQPEITNSLDERN